MASESDSVEQNETINEIKPKETKNEDSGSLKRSFEGNSDYQPEAKKLAMSDNSTTSSGETRHTPLPVQSPNHGQGSNNPQMGQVTEHIRVPDKMVGLLIGKGGEQITNIQNECQCRIQFAPSKPGSNERECSISGPAANVMKGRKVIDDIVFKNQLVLLGGDEGYIDMYIPGNKVGLIIGKNGDTIKQLQEKSGVKVAVIQNNTEATAFDKPLRITGNKVGVQKAREMVNEILNEHDRIGTSRPSYGGHGGHGGHSGFVGPSGGNKVNLQIPVPRNLVGIVIGKGGEMIKKIQEESGAKVQFKSDDIAQEGPERVCHVYGFKQNTDLANQMIHDLIKQGMNRINGGGNMNFRAVQTPFVNGSVHTIPSDKCGLVIGKGGENIKEINRVSGAHAELIRENNDPNVKRFRIQGTPDQVQACIQLINEKAGLPPIMSGPNYGGIQSQGIPSLMAQFPALNMPGPAGNIVTSFPGQAQVVLPSATVYGAQVQQAQWSNAGGAGAYHPQATPGPFNQPATVVVDPTKAGDQNATAWAAYYAQLYGSSAAGVQGQVAGSSAVPGGVQAIPAAPVVTPGAPGGHPTMAYTTQVIPAPAAQTATQPQPTINPITGQHDYSLAWAEYYRAQGLHQQAAAIMQGAGLPAPQ